MKYVMIRLTVALPRLCIADIRSPLRNVAALDICELKKSLMFDGMLVSGSGIIDMSSLA